VSQAAPFDFDALDGLAFAAERGRLAGRTLGRMNAVSLGPIIELAQLAGAGILPAPERADWLALDGLAVLYQSVLSGRFRWVCPDGRRIGFLRTCAQEQSNDHELIGFSVAARQAAGMAGFSTTVAQQLAAAVAELHSNIHDHSRASKTGLIAFRAGVGEFELVIADRGVGILETLRTCAEYAHIRDHGTALMLALTEGVSRHGSSSGHGFGFRPIFTGLANIKGYLRFRSGDHALILDGTKPSLTTAKPAQKPAISGFLVSITCAIEARPTRDDSPPFKIDRTPFQG
jgi:anti-sigma regulatory factor (Ser/Thr protein kinase)